MLVFRKYGRLEEDVKLSFKGRRVRFVEEWSYLGVKFKAKGNLFSSHIESRIEKGKACCNMVLRSQLRDIKKIQVVKEVFRAKILGVMPCASEVWGYVKGESLERVQLGLYTRCLWISKNTSSIVVRGDLGLFSLRSRRLINMVRLWKKFLVMPRVRVMKAAYLEMLKGSSGKGWPYQIKSVLDQCGLSLMLGIV